LTARERDVLVHLARGLSNPEVASALNLSRHTVKQHTSAVYKKLGVRNRAEAASRAQRLGLAA
jgi:two-component system response regulator DesR